ncbi:cytochrome P450 [Gordonia sp. GN26]
MTSHELARAVMGDQRFSRGASGSPLSPPDNQAAILFDAISREGSFPEAARARAEVYRNEGRLPDALWDPEIIQALHSEPLPNMPYSNMDPPKHTRIRRLLTGHFTVKNVNRHRERIEEIVEECLDALEAHGAPVDVVEPFAVAIASRMSCEILGIPSEERETLERLSAVRNKPGVGVEEILEANRGLRAFAGHLIERKRSDPGEDLVSALLRNGDMTDDELMSAVVLLELAAVLTTSTTLASGIAALLRDREQWNRLVDAPEDVAIVVEELLRFTSAVQAAETRTALEDVEIGGEVIKAYERVAVSLAAANRDPELFENPDEFDVSRHAGKHMTFGHGVHQCLGQQLVRLELHIALTALARRFPTLDLAVPVDEIAWPVGDVEFFGPRELPVKW